jgi:putative tricarboxylic transport membrane protein
VTPSPPSLEKAPLERAPGEPTGEQNPGAQKRPANQVINKKHNGRTLMTHSMYSALRSRARGTAMSALGTVMLLASPAVSAPYPERDITMIIPFGVGGGSDTLARTIGNVIGELKVLPVQILPENRPGGSGAVGYSSVAKEKANPHIVATVSVSFFTTPLQGGSPVSYRDFTPLAAIAQSPYVLVVPAASEYKTLDDLKKAKRLTTGTVGVVSDAALLAKMTSNALGMRIDPVPFDGEGEVMAAMLGGHVNVAYFNPSEVLSQIQAGTLRPLAISSAQRAEAFPDVPTFKELGYDIVHTQIRGLVMPKGVSPEVVSYWEDLLKKVAESPQWRTQYIDRFHDDVNFLDSAQFGKAIAETSDRYEHLMKELGVIK